MEILKYIQEIEEVTINTGLSPNNIRDGVTIFSSSGGVIGTMQNIAYEANGLSADLDTTLSDRATLDSYLPGETMTGRLEISDSDASYDNRVMTARGVGASFATATALRMAPSISDEMLESIRNTIREAVREEFRSLRISRDDTVTYSYTPEQPLEYIRTTINLSTDTEDSAPEEPSTGDE